MIQTKHIYIFFVLVIAILILWGLLSILDKNNTSIEINELIFVDAPQTYTVIASDTRQDSEVNNDFIKRVRNYLARNAAELRTAEETVIQAPPKEPEPVFSQGVVSLAPKIGAVYVCPEMLAASYVFDIPHPPVQGYNPLCLSAENPIGILNSGEFLYSAASLDETRPRNACGAYLHPSGQYRHYKESPCVSVNTDGAIGYAFDGFPIYPSIENGIKITNQSLDTCHGHAHTKVQNGVEVFIYHYHMTDEYPYSIGCFSGSPIMHDELSF